jgi:mycothione reductase
LRKCCHYHECQHYRIALDPDNPDTPHNLLSYPWELWDNNILHPDKKIPVNYVAMPHAIFSSPQVAGVGLTEQELKKEGMEYQKSLYPYINTGMGLALEERDGFVKFLADKTKGRILGCHIIGSEASILIHEVLVAMSG